MPFVNVYRIINQEPPFYEEYDLGLSFETFDRAQHKLECMFHAPGGDKYMLARVVQKEIWRD